MTRLLRFKGIVFCVLLVVFNTACASSYRGYGSMTLLTKDISKDSSNIELVGSVDEESESFYWILIFGMFGDPGPNHEAPIDRLLKKHNADIIIDAELSDRVIGIPYIFMIQESTVKGQPARFKGSKKNEK